MIFGSVHVLLFVTPWTAAHQTSVSFTVFWSLLKLMSIEPVMPSNHLILCHPLLLPSIFPSIKVFSNESVLRIRWPKYWSFSFSISPSNEYSGPISFRINWFDLLAVQGTLKSLLQHHSWNTSILQRSTFLTVQLSHPYMSTGKKKKDYCICSGILYYSLLLFSLFSGVSTPIADPGETSQFLETANNLPKSMLFICKPTITPVDTFV